MTTKYLSFYTLCPDACWKAVLPFIFKRCPSKCKQFYLLVGLYLQHLLRLEEIKICILSYKPKAYPFLQFGFSAFSTPITKIKKKKLKNKVVFKWA